MTYIHPDGNCSMCNITNPAPLDNGGAPAPTRTVPEGWIELPPNFTLEVEHGIHPGWMYINQPGLGGETITYAPPDGGTPRAWSIRRERTLAQPMQINVVPPPEPN